MKIKLKYNCSFYSPHLDHGGDVFTAFISDYIYIVIRHWAGVPKKIPTIIPTNNANNVKDIIKSILPDNGRMYDFYSTDDAPNSSWAIKMAIKKLLK